MQQFFSFIINQTEQSKIDLKDSKHREKIAFMPEARYIPTQFEYPISDLAFFVREQRPSGAR
jgi:hypothetical protein